MNATSQAEHIDPVDRQVGANVRLRRRALGMSQASLASAINLTFQQVQKYERGTNRISASKLYAIAAVLGLPIESLFEGLPGTAKTARRARADDHARDDAGVAGEPG